MCALHYLALPNSKTNFIEEIFRFRWGCSTKFRIFWNMAGIYYISCPVKRDCNFITLQAHSSFVELQIITSNESFLWFLLLQYDPLSLKTILFNILKMSRKTITIFTSKIKFWLITLFFHRLFASSFRSDRCFFVRFDRKWIWFRIT